MKPEISNSIQVIAAVLIVALIGVASLWMWKAEGRNTDDLSLGIQRKQLRDARLARTTKPLIDKIEALRLREAGIAPLQINPVGKELRDVQNVVAAQMPELVASYDSDGNAVIIPVQDARRILNALIDAVKQD